MEGSPQSLILNLKLPATILNFILDKFPIMRIGSTLRTVPISLILYHFGPRVYPLGSLVFALVVRLCVRPSLNISETH